MSGPSFGHLWSGRTPRSTKETGFFGCSNGHLVQAHQARVPRDLSSSGTFFPLSQALVATSLLLNAVEIAATLVALFQEQVFSVDDHRLCALHLGKDKHLFWGVHDGKCITGLVRASREAPIDRLHPFISKCTLAHREITYGVIASRQFIPATATGI